MLDQYSDESQRERARIRSILAAFTMEPNPGRRRDLFNEARGYFRYSRNDFDGWISWRDLRHYVAHAMTSYDSTLSAIREATHGDERAVQDAKALLSLRIARHFDLWPPHGLAEEDAAVEELRLLQRFGLW